MKNKVQDGKTMNYKALADIKGGDLVLLPACVGVALTDIAKDAVGALELEGVFEFTKDNSDFAQGAKVYAKDDNIVTATAEGNQVCGIAFEEVGAGDTVVVVKINA